MNKTIKLVFLLITIFTLIISCEKNTKPDTTPPNVAITNPQNGSTVFELTLINCVATDNEKIDKVELWVDGNSTTIIDETEPYSLVWDTTIYEDESIHTITVRAYDESENMTDSDPITLIVNNTNSYPSQINLNPTEYNHINQTFIITWNKSQDIDFDNYQLFESLSENMSDMNIIFNSNAINDTIYIVSEVYFDETRFYQLVVSDTIGFSTSSIIEEASSYCMFINTYGSGVGKSVIYIPDVGYVIVGTSNSDIILLKADTYGYEEWRQYFGGSSGDQGHSLQNTSDGGFIIAGYTSSFGNGSYDFWLIKTDSQGNEIWNQTFGNTELDECLSVNQTSDGGYILTGYTVINGNYDVWLVKTDTQGNEEWNQIFGGSDYDWGKYVAQTEDGGYIITGKTSSYGSGSSNIWLIKTDSQGNEIWSQTFGGNQGVSCTGYSVQQTLDGGYIIVGHTDIYWSSRHDDAWLIKTDYNGQEEWNRIIGGSESDQGRAVQQTLDGGFIITGITSSFGSRSYDAWLIKTDTQGNEEWMKTFGEGDSNSGYDVEQTNDGGYIVTGSTSNEIWLIKTNSEGEILP